MAAQLSLSKNYTVAKINGILSHGVLALEEKIMDRTCGVKVLLKK